MMDVAQPQIQDDRSQLARHKAADMFRREPDWVTFYREVLAVDGIIDQLFPTTEKRNAFEKTPEYEEIQRMLARLRERTRIQKQPTETTRVITVRLPESLHEWLRHEAHNLKTSMNKLCISKLLQVVADDLVPSDFQRREPEPAPSPAETPQPPVATAVAFPKSPSNSEEPFPRIAAPQPAPTPPITPPPITGGRPF